MSEFVYTEEMVEYVKKVAPGRYNDEITKLFNKKFRTKLTVEQMANMKSKRKIRSNVSSQGRGARRLFTDEQEQFIRENAKGLLNKEITELVNDKFKTSFTTRQVKNLKHRRGISSHLTGQFKKGQEPWNKGMKGLSIGGVETQFKKGQAPVNYRPVGSERVTVDGYIEIKTADPRTWELKHRVVWEKHYGKIPDDRVVSFYDTDQENITIENLFLLTKAENARMNQGGLYSTDPELTKVGIALVRLNEKVREKERGYTNDELREFAKEAEKNGINYQTFMQRIHNKWTIEDAVNLPLNSKPTKRRS